MSSHAKRDQRGWLADPGTTELPMIPTVARALTNNVKSKTHLMVAMLAIIVVGVLLGAPLITHESLGAVYSSPAIWLTVVGLIVSLLMVFVPFALFLTRDARAQTYLRTAGSISVTEKGTGLYPWYLQIGERGMQVEVAVAQAVRTASSHDYWSGVVEHSRHMHAVIEIRDIEGIVQYRMPSYNPPRTLAHSDQGG